MFIEIIHPGGQRYRIPASQVVIHNDDGNPVAVAYETSGLLVYTDVTKGDFNTVVGQLKLKKVDTQVLNV